MLLFMVPASGLLLYSSYNSRYAYIATCGLLAVSNQDSSNSVGRPELPPLSPLALADLFNSQSPEDGQGTFEQPKGWNEPTGQPSDPVCLSLQLVDEISNLAIQLCHVSGVVYDVVRVDEFAGQRRLRSYPGSGIFWIGVRTSTSDETLELYLIRAVKGV